MQVNTMRPRRGKYLKRTGRSFRATPKAAAPYSMYRGILPARTTAVLKYADIVQLVDTLAGFSAQVVKVNSCFDMDDSLGGHQPLGFDQYSAFYSNYRVTKARVVGHYSNNQSTVPVIVGITPNETNSTSLTQSQLEWPGGKNAILAQDTAGPITTTLSLTMDMAKFDGNVGARTDDKLQAAVTADPVDIKFMHLWAKSGVSALTVDVTLLFEVYVTVEFFNRKSLNVS